MVKLFATFINTLRFYIIILIVTEIFSDVAKFLAFSAKFFPCNKDCYYVRTYIEFTIDFYIKKFL